MGHSQAEKALSRERILAEASRQVRDGGLESVSVGALMKSVGLTHGGFYGHFESREALLAEALERALLEGEAKAGAGGAPASFSAIVRSYLSRTHRDSRDSGCAVAALDLDQLEAQLLADRRPQVPGEHRAELLQAVGGVLGTHDASPASSLSR